MLILVAAVVLAVAAVGALLYFRGGPDVEETIAQPTVPVALPQAVVELPSVRFTDITTEAGIDFVHTNGSTELDRKLLPETMGAGCAFFDYDNDGDQDLLLVNSRRWPGDETSDEPPTIAMYANDGSGAFSNVSERLGLAVSFYGMGASVADYNNDGYLDVFITGVGGNHLFRNIEGKRFDDVTIEAAVGGPADWPDDAETFLDHTEPITWSTGSAWLDYDRDGFLDLFVCNYVRWSPKIDSDIGFQLVGIGRAFGPPTNFSGAHCFLYRNLGNGAFEDVTKPAGIEVYSSSALQTPVGKALAVVAADVDDDGWTDLVVANDTVPNFLFRNQGDGTFVEEGQQVGVAMDGDGRATGAMGVDAAQPRNDGMLVIPIGNFSSEMTSFYVRQEGARFTMVDEARIAGIGTPTRQALTFGTLFFDFDLDGRLDLMTANGHLEEEINVNQPGQHYEQPPQLFWNAGLDQTPEFVLLTQQQVGEDLLRPIVGRGLAYADIDNDGDLDVLLTANGGPPRLLRNEAVSPSRADRPHWVRIVLEGTQAPRTPIGTRVELVAGGGQMVQRRELIGGRSYLSQPQLAITFGLGVHQTIDELRVTWPGQEDPQIINGVEIDRTHHIKQSQ